MYNVMSPSVILIFGIFTFFFVIGTCLYLINEYFREDGDE